MTIGRFVCGIAALIFDPTSEKYLLLKRSETKDAGAGEWECVTGRVDQGESFEQALHREVREEVGISVKVGFIIGTTHFYRGEAIPENELLGLKYFCTLADPNAIQVSDEHSEQRWLTAGEIAALLSSEHWLVKTVQRAEITRKRLPSDLIALHEREGFE